MAGLFEIKDLGDGGSANRAYRLRFVPPSLAKFRPRFVVRQDYALGAGRQPVIF